VVWPVNHFLAHLHGLQAYMCELHRQILSIGVKQIWGKNGIQTQPSLQLLIKNNEST